VENEKRRETGKSTIPKSAIKLRSGEMYRDAADAPRIATIYNGLSGRGVFVPFRKGDPEGSRWIDNEPLYIEWSTEAVNWLSSDPSARWQGTRFFLKEGVTWSLHANHVPVKCRLQPACIFDASGSRLTPVTDKLSPHAFVAVVNSNVFSFFLRKFIKHNQDVEVNDMRAMPIIIPTDSQLATLEDLARHAIETRRSIFAGETPSHDLIAFVRQVGRSLMKAVPEYLKPNAQMLLLETAQDCLDTIQLAVNWEAEKLYNVEGLGPFDEF